MDVRQSHTSTRPSLVSGRQPPASCKPLSWGIGTGAEQISPLFPLHDPRPAPDTLPDRDSSRYAAPTQLAAPSRPGPSRPPLEDGGRSHCFLTSNKEEQDRCISPPRASITRARSDRTAAPLSRCQLLCEAIRTLYSSHARGESGGEARRGERRGRSSSLPSRFRERRSGRPDPGPGCSGIRGGIAFPNLREDSEMSKRHHVLGRRGRGEGECVGTQSEGSRATTEVTEVPIDVNRTMS